MARQPKKWEPFENKIEWHPWERFPEKPNKARNLIVGSFPPNKFTSHQERLTLCDMGFFYGSKENDFWELFIEAIDLTYKWPDDLADLKVWLINNHWAVTDIIKKAQRKEDTAFDEDLIVLEWNHEVIEQIFHENEITRIFFTSQWVKNRFDNHIKGHLLAVDFSAIKEIILLSPSKNGLRNAKRAKFARQICMPKSDEKATGYRKRYYSRALHLK